MKYQEICDCCGGVVTAYTHSINVQLVSALRQLVDYYQITKSPCNLQESLNLTHNQLANFQKLRYFGLAYNIDIGWLPTVEGIKFIYGEHKIENPVATMANKVLPNNHPAWETHTRGRSLLAVGDIDKVSYKKRLEYQMEKSPQTNLQL